jgi:hypothetical protein
MPGGSEFRGLAVFGGIQQSSGGLLESAQILWLVTALAGFGIARRRRKAV